MIRLQVIEGAIHSTKISGNFGPKLNGSVRSNRKSFEKTGLPFDVDHFSRSDRSEFWLNGSRSEDPNMHDQIVFCAFHTFFSGSPNGCWLHTNDERVITTWRLGLQVTRGASKNALSKRNIVITLAQHFCALKQVVLRKQKQTWTATLTFALFQLFLRQ